MRLIGLALLMLMLAACTSPTTPNSYMPRTPQFGAVQPKPNHGP